MQALQNFANNNWPTAMGIAVILFGIGLTIATKFDSKFGYVVSLVGLALALYTLHVLHIF